MVSLWILFVSVCHGNRAHVVSWSLKSGFFADWSSSMETVLTCDAIFGSYLLLYPLLCWLSKQVSPSAFFPEALPASNHIVQDRPTFEYMCIRAEN